MSEQESTLDDFSDTPTTEDTKSEQRESRFWGIIPEGWELVDGNEVYDVNPNPKPTEEPNTYIEMDALDTVLPWPKYFGRRNASEYSGKTFTEGDTLFARITPCTENGKAAFVPKMETEVGIGSTEYAVLSPKTNRIHPWLLYYLSKSYPVHNYAVSRMRGSTGRQRVPFSVFRHELDIALPPLPEQRKIATVLYTIDRKIEKTEEIMEQIGRIEKAITQNLLSGENRNTNNKTARVGPKEVIIPENWEVNRIAEISDIKNGNRIVKGHDYSDTLTEYPFIRIVDMKNGSISTSDIKYLKKETAEKMERGIIYSDDVYITVTGRVGDAGTIPEELDGARFTDNAAKLYNLDGVIPEYLSLYLRSKYGQDEVHRFTVGSTQPKLSMYRVEKMEVILPPIDEQKEIVQKLNNIKQNKAVNEELVDSLISFKLGLMQDLLSGTIRTTDTNIQVPDEVAQHG